MTPRWIEVIQSLVSGRNALFREELPTPQANPSDTKYVPINSHNE